VTLVIIIENSINIVSRGNQMSDDEDNCGRSLQGYGTIRQNILTTTTVVSYMTLNGDGPFCSWLHAVASDSLDQIIHSLVVRFLVISCLFDGTQEVKADQSD
jgi:hypothetical protein